MLDACEAVSDALRQMGVGLKVTLEIREKCKCIAAKKHFWQIHLTFIHNPKQGEVVLNTLFEQLIYPQLPYYHYEDEICIQKEQTRPF